MPLKVLRKWTFGQTPSAEEDHVIKSKAPEQLLNINNSVQGQELTVNHN